MQSMNIYLIQTCVELVIVLRAKIVAQSFTVDELSNAPWVSIKSTTICLDKDNDVREIIYMYPQQLVPSDTELVFIFQESRCFLRRGQGNH